MTQVDSLFRDKDKLVLASFSHPQDSLQKILRVRIKPVLLKKKHFFHVEEFSKTQSFAKNIPSDDFVDLCRELLHEFNQAIIRFEDKEVHYTMQKNGKATIKEKPISTSKNLQHNRSKIHPISEHETLDFLVHLGIQNTNGKVFRDKHDKFKQINQFIHLLTPVFDAFDKGRPLCIVDLACGKAYLTFALYYFLTEKLGFEVTLYGVDLKIDVLQKCQTLAHDLGYHGMHFVSGAIDAFNLDTKADLVVALHACDTATDSAILKALSLDAKAIAVAPCCQHEIAKQLKKDAFPLVCKHGLLKERYAALITDAFRSEFLEQEGYKTDLLEFVDPEHTPKNLLIRAIKKDKYKVPDFTELQAILKQLGIQKISLVPS